MKSVIALLIVIALTVALMLQIRADSGYVLLSYGSYSLETSLIVLLVALLLVFFGLYLALRTLVATIKLPSRAKQFSRKRLRQKAADSLQTGLLQLAEGNWDQAQKRLANHADNSRLAVVHYLGAARAAQQADDIANRDAWLTKAYQAAPHSEVAIGLAKAELQLQANQLVHALATLRMLREKHPHHSYVLRLLALTHIQLNEWQELEALLDDISAAKAFDKQGLLELRAKLRRNRIEQITEMALSGRHGQAAEHLAAFWKRLNKSERDDIDTLVNFAKAEHASNNDKRAADLIESVLKKQWQAEAAALYGWLDIEQKRALKAVESWLATHGDQPELLLTAARVCMRYKLWGRARSWLTHLSTSKPSEEVWRELAALEESQGNNVQAAKAWRAAATLSGNTVMPLLPEMPSTASENDDNISAFTLPDIAGPECIDNHPAEADSADDADADDESQLPITPAAAYSNESKNS